LSAATLSPIIRSKAYDYPASYLIDHPEIQETISYSATYAGQACSGEVMGIVEKSLSGHCCWLMPVVKQQGSIYKSSETIL
jgi:hypothetical protein